MLREKIIILDSYADGNLLREASVREGYSFLNLRVETLHGIANRENRYKTINNHIAILYVYSILRKLQADNQLIYFDKLQIYPGFVKAIYNTIYDLRMAGYTSENLKENCFINLDKAADIKKILSGYEQILIDNNFIDDYALYQAAMGRKVNSTNKAIYMVPANLKLRLAEAKFLDFLTEGNTQPMETLITYGNDKSPLSYLYDIESLPKDLPDINIEFISAFGRSNESKEVIRKIKSNKINLDNAVVFYTTREPYAQYFYLLSQKLGLPITFGEGIAIKNTYPSKLYSSLIGWIKDDYKISDFISALNSGYFSFDEEAPSTSKLIDLLRESKIVWGRERYSTSIDRLTELVKAKLDGSNSQDKLDNLIWLSSLIKELFESLPLPNNKGLINLAELAKGIHIIVDKYSKANSEMDSEAKKSILGMLDVLMEHSKELVDVKEGIIQLLENVEELRVGVSNPKPGHIHVSSYKKGIWINRQNTFIIGLDSSTFPGQAIEDPILLDIERQALGNKIPLKKFKSKENQADMVQLLTSLKGNIYLSYCSFDTLENKAQSPSALLLQAYRLHTKNPRVDYEGLSKYFKRVAGFLIEREDYLLDEDDWWLKMHILDNFKTTDDVFSNIYQNLTGGINALNIRNSEFFTEYDGKVEFDINETGIMRNGKLILSSSQLEMLATCPYKYFLRYILKAKKPDDVEFSSVQWLDPATRGTLLHKVFEKFYQELKSRDESPSINNHESLIQKIASDEMEEVRKILVPPSNLIYELERSEILDSCRVFLAYEEENQVGYLPSYLELSFGIGGDKHKELGEISEVEIKLPSGKKIYINGKIDRVDQLSTKDFVIIDYKTGSSYGYKDNEYFKKGKHLQHAIYAIALETILKDKNICSNPNVSKSVYTFPTLKGEGQMVIRTRERRDGVYAILDKLLSVVDAGSFISTEDEESCKYCDYRVVCENISSKGAIDSMRSNSHDKGVESMRGLGIYE
ncbi:MAG: PD-(D/E)XK nuclease family protein [Vulcanibacillus sp.]